MEYLNIIKDAEKRISESTETAGPVKERKLKALSQIRFRAAKYESAIYCSEIVDGYARKKCNFLISAKIIGEINEIMSLPKPHFNGNKFLDSPYQTDEEELIAWSEASLRAPLNSAAINRMQELMKRVFPDKKIFDDE